MSREDEHAGWQRRLRTVNEQHRSSHRKTEALHMHTFKHQPTSERHVGHGRKEAQSRTVPAANQKGEIEATVEPTQPATRKRRAELEALGEDGRSGIKTPQQRGQQGTPETRRHRRGGKEANQCKRCNARGGQRRWRGGYRLLAWAREHTTLRRKRNSREQGNERGYPHFHPKLGTEQARQWNSASNPHAKKPCHPDQRRE